MLHPKIAPEQPPLLSQRRRQLMWHWLGMVVLLSCGELLAQESTPARAKPAEIPETVVEAAPPVTPSPSAEPNAGNSPFTPSTENFPGAASRELANSIERIGRGQSELGKTSSASSGVFGQVDLESRPLLRPSSILDAVPGLVATQHSGSGKANQFFLRGVNLDHGTDINLRYDGVPINLPTHAHGQGYLDVNWVIPELIESINYRLGAYAADVGDFSSVGSVDLKTIRAVPTAIATTTYGSFDYLRVFAADSTKVKGGDLLFAYETVLNNGPWDVPEKLDKFNGLIKYTHGDELEGFSLEGLAYRSYWTATNQIPRRAVEDGIISRFGSLDPSDGGMTDRVTLNSQYWREDDNAITKANAYVAYYDLNLYSDFTFFLEDPVHGDQINQQDRRIYTGANVSREWLNDYGSNTLGFQFRNDSIDNVALNHTQQRTFLETVKQDTVDQQSFSLYGSNKTRWTDWMRSDLGLRGDMYRFHTHDFVDLANTDTTTAGILSPKTSLVIGPWGGTELFTNWGLSFHSNDARGVNSAVDPSTPLVRSNSSEIGARSQVTEQWKTTLVAWYLTINSELVFVGDEGTNEPSGASHRGGINWTNYYKLNDWATFDCDYAFVRPRFQGGDHIPNTVNNVVSAGITAGNFQQGYYGTVRVQSYGPSSLIEDDSAQANTTTLVNAQLGRSWDRLRLSVDIFNLLNTQASSITYYYESQPAGLAAANDFHFHPVAPLSARFNASMTY